MLGLWFVVQALFGASNLTDPTGRRRRRRLLRPHRRVRVRAGGDQAVRDQASSRSHRGSRSTDHVRLVVLTIALMFIAALGVLTALDIARYGVTALAILAILVLVLFMIGIVGAFESPQGNDRSRGAARRACAPSGSGGSAKRARRRRLLRDCALAAVTGSRRCSYSWQRGPAGRRRRPHTPRRAARAAEPHAAPRQRLRRDTRIAPGGTPTSKRRCAAACCSTCETAACCGSRASGMRVPIASLTKMMTALVVVAHARPSARVLITQAALDYSGSGCRAAAEGQDGSSRDAPVRAAAAVRATTPRSRSRCMWPERRLASSR